MKQVLFGVSILLMVAKLSAQTPESIVAEIDYQGILELPYSQAIDSLGLLMNKYPEDIELYYYRGLCHAQNNKGALALEDASKYQNSLSKKSAYNAHILMGRVHLLRIAPSLALQSFENAISLDGSRPEAYGFIGMIYLKGRNVDNGLKFISKAIKKHPNITELYLHRAGLYLYLNETKKALSDFKVIIDAGNKVDSSISAQAHYGIARIYMRKKKYNDALSYTEQGIKLSKSSIVGYGMLGEIKYYLKDYSGAIIEFRKYEENIRSSNYWIFMAESYEKTGDINSACLYYNAKCSLLIEDNKACSKAKKLKCEK